MEVEMEREEVDCDVVVAVCGLQKLDELAGRRELAEPTTGDAINFCCPPELVGHAMGHNGLPCLDATARLT